MDKKTISTCTLIGCIISACILAGVDKKRKKKEKEDMEKMMKMTNDALNGIFEDIQQDTENKFQSIVNKES